MKFFGALVAFLLALLVAGSSDATVTTSRGQAGGWVVSFVNGDTADSAAIDNTCATWRVSFDLGGGSAAATIYGLTNSTDATSVGTALTGGTLTASSLAAPVVVSTALPYIKVDVVTGPSSGTARVWLFCTLSAGGGSGFSTASMPAAVSTSSTASWTPTGLSVPVVSATDYLMWCWFLTSSANATGTIGVNMQVTGPANTRVHLTRHYCSTNGSSVPDNVVAATAFHTATDDNTTTSSGTTQCRDRYAVMLIGSGNGTVAIGFQPEIDANSVTVHTGTCAWRAI